MHRTASCFAGTALKWLPQLLRAAAPGLGLTTVAQNAPRARPPSLLSAFLAAGISCLQTPGPKTLALLHPGAFPASALLSCCTQGAGCKDLGLKVGSAEGPQPEVFGAGVGNASVAKRGGEGWEQKRAETVYFPSLGW